MLLDSHLFPLAAFRQITEARLRKHAINLRRVVSVALMIALLAGSTPPAMANSLMREALMHAQEESSSLAGLAVTLAQKALVSFSSQGPGSNRGVRPRPPESRAEKEVRAATLRINPGGEVVLQSRQPMLFTAIPLDAEGTPIHGLPVEWESSDKQVVFVTKNGQAVAGKPGSATLAAMAGRIKEIVRIVVVEGTKENFGGKKRQNSKRIGRRIGQNSGNVNLVNTVARNTIAGTKLQQTLRFSTGSRNGLARGTERLALASASARTQSVKPQAGTATLRFALPASPLPLRPPEEDPLPDDETNSLYQADNAVGSPPGKRKAGALTPAVATEGTESGNQNFTFALPVAGLGGRGLGVSLSLVYNSQVFNKSTDPFDNSTWMSYDVDSGWPAPGFRLGFGQIEDQGGFGFTLTDADGTRHALTQTSAFNYETTDGTFIHFTGGSGWGTLFYPDGTRVSYGAAGGGIRSYPIQITDRNGNYILISYVNGVGPKISSIQDTLQRYVHFYYASNGDLVTITAPGLTGDLQAMRFYYHDVSIPQSGLFASGVNVSGAPVSVHTLKYIYLPSSVETNGAHIGYRYDYSAYGMMYQIRQFRGMTVDSASTSSPGSVTGEGSQAALTSYDYPTSASGLSDVPTYQHRTDDWAGRTTGMNGDPSAAPVYTFSTSQQTGEKITTVTAPDGTINETHAKDAPGQWDDGLMQQTIVKSGSATLAKTVIDWEQTPNGGPPRVASVRITNDGNPAQTKATVLTYTSFNNVSIVSERDFTTDGSVSSAELRRTETSYVTSSNYINRRLLHLQSTVKVFAGGSTTPSSRTDFAYDDYGASHANLTRRDDIIMHDPAFDPFQPLQENCEWQCMNWQFIDGFEQCVDWQWVCTFSTPYDPSTDYRGNITSVTTYPDASSTSGTITHSTTYDIAGNVMTAQVACCEQKSFTYSGSGPSGNHDYAYPISVTTGSGGTTLTAGASYDYNTGLVDTTTDENNQQTSNSYFASSLRLSEVDYPDGGQTLFTYNDGLSADANGEFHFFVETSTKLDAPGGSPRYVNSRRYFDGRGAVARTFDNHTAANGWSTQDIEYDIMGRAYRASNPYYSSGPNSPINPDGFWTTSTFDRLGRATQVTMPRGDDNNALTTTVQISYAGTVTAATDQAGKQRRQITDALGRVIRLDEPDASGNLGNVDSPAQATGYEYDALGNLIHIAQGAQHRFFKYDSLSRLTHERQVEQNAPWTTSDSVAGNNQWSRKIIYNSNNLVTDAYDARQRRTQFIYDGLNRVSQIAYFLANGSPDPATPAAFYFYDSQTLPSGAPSFNRGHSVGRLVAMTYGAATSTTGNYFGYDSMGRVWTQKQVTGSTTYSLSYAYNHAGLLTGETYPTSRALNYSYDEGARLLSMSDGTTTFANSFSYTAHGGLTSETYGNGMVHALEYNRRLQASKITLKQNSSATTPLQQYDYGYGQFNPSTGAVDTSKNNGQIGKVVGTIGTTTQWLQGFSYDSLARLSNVAEYQGGNISSQTYSQGYTYDRYGNRFQSANTTLGLPAVSSSEIDTSTNRFINSGSTPTTYDPAGKHSERCQVPRDELQLRREQSPDFRRAHRPH